MLGVQTNEQRRCLAVHALSAVGLKGHRSDSAMGIYAHKCMGHGNDQHDMNSIEMNLAFLERL